MAKATTAKIDECVRKFLSEMGWTCERLDERHLRTIVFGNTAQWVWAVRWNQEGTALATYSLCPLKVPADRRAAAAEYITRANFGLNFGNFEMDFDDGEVSFKTSVRLAHARLTPQLIKDLAFANFSNVDCYLPGLMAVIFGHAAPKAAIDKAEGRAPKAPETAAGAGDGETPAGDDDQEDEPASSSPSPNRVLLRPQAVRICRTGQLQEYLELMDKRAHEEAKGSCFLSVEVEPPAATDPVGPGDETQPGETLPRLVQFCFEDKWFALDIPRANIHPHEARRLVRSRRGFYREAERPGAGVTDTADLLNVDPVGKKYIYGDEREAAEDLAYVLYDLWGLPPGTPLRLKAAAFHTEHKWEDWELP